MSKVSLLIVLCVVFSIILFCMILSVGSGGEIFSPIDSFFDGMLDPHSSEYITCGAENSYCWGEKK